MTETISKSTISYPPVAADTYSWPYDGANYPATTAVLMIDWQTDFCLLDSLASQ